MATFLLSALANGSVIAFDPALDIISLDDPAIGAAEVQASSPTATSVSLTVPALGKTVTLNGLAFAQITPGNLVFADGSRFLVGDQAVGTAGDAVGNSIVGTGFDDSLYGLAGNDTLIGGGGSDLLDGGTGIDTASYVDAPSGVTVNLNVVGLQDTGGSGLDTLVDIEGLRGSDFNDVLGGDATANMIEGGLGDDLIDGGSGSDRLDGGSGFDTLSYATAASGVTINLSLNTAQNTGGAGTDTVLRFENIVGSAFNDILIGTAIANEIDGGGGNDFIDGGLNDDRVSYASATGAVTVNLGLTTQQDTIGAGLDTLVNIEKVAGSPFDDTLIGNDGPNVLNGRAGADTMTGGLDTDAYFVDNSGDVVIEEANFSGVRGDTVHSSVNFVLGPNVENLALLGLAISGTGNELNNVIGGNASDNVLDGGPGRDTLTHFFFPVAVQANLATGIATGVGPGIGTDTFVGFEDLQGSPFDDTLTGNSSANRLDGYLGRDTMVGGDGNDTYIVDNRGDVVIEALNAGTDAVRSGITLTLPANVENLILFDGAAINGTGNTAANQITGNSANNVLNGGVGNDTLIGGLGNDIFVVDSALDVVDDTGGVDKVHSSVSWVLDAGLENLTLLGSANINGTGNGVNNVVVGNAGNNALIGSGGNDTLVGGFGNDVLAGGAGVDRIGGGGGADRFVFNAAAQSGAGIGLRDVLTDFSAAQGDRIDLFTIDANPGVAGDQGFVFIGAAAFSDVGQVRFAGGLLQANVGGTLAADFEVLLSGVATLAGTDLVL